MEKIGLFYGTETGSTRVIARKIYHQLGDALVAKPLNVNRITPAEFLRYDAYILGAPSYGEGAIPGHSAGCLERNWQEFLAQLGNANLYGKRIAMFGLGSQERYPDNFASSLMPLHQSFAGFGAEMVGEWPTAGYHFNHSAAVVDDHFVGLVLDQRAQGAQSGERLTTWLDQVTPRLIKRLQQAA
ncbi:flavodoxin [Pseudomaricurvus sp. HS19]|uniref:flavodoxin n=1 Tax=Pseudomaricurvus sp. HS19 TaxID=2692626 RepID=UPI00136BACBF|nr:flavodoxin [Pseudomaricurvus sp. HS19]MYM64831.1 flavodoxin [Pseudomaricurvus sp. HS19]